MLSREEPAFIPLLNTPEITEITPGWSQVAEAQQTAAPTQRLQDLSFSVFGIYLYLILLVGSRF